MKHVAAAIILVALLGLAGCAGSGPGGESQTTSVSSEVSSSVSVTSGVSETPEPEAATDKPEEAEGEPSGQGDHSMLNIEVGDTTLQATLADNSSAASLVALLEEGPIELSLHDYGNFEKVGPLPQSLPTNDEQITTEPGDVILYQGNQITIYYDVNSWSFTRLAKIEGTTTEELLAVLGEGDVEVTLSLAG